jgi:hypothetical protein
MDWETQLGRYAGKKVEVVIEDLAGADPLAPAAMRTLHKVRLTDEGTHVQIFFNDTQFLSIPVFDDLRTCIDEAAGETLFISHDEAGKLIYKLRLV